MLNSVDDYGIKEDFQKACRDEPSTGCPKGTVHTMNFNRLEFISSIAAVGVWEKSLAFGASTSGWSASAKEPPKIAPSSGGSSSVSSHNCIARKKQGA